jgi:hypothetical protein
MADIGALVMTLRRDGDVRGLQSLRTFDHIELHLSATRSGKIPLAP